MNKAIRATLGLVVLVALAGVVWFAARPTDAPQVRANVVGLTNVVDDAGFARATDAREFAFPADHGAHDDFRSEWWYFTGNLADASGRPFGYQFTIFRHALAPGATHITTSSFASNQIYFAHFAVTDIAAKTHIESEKFSRAAAGLAGATTAERLRAQPADAARWRVWIEDWSAEALNDDLSAMRVRAKANTPDGPIAIELDLTSQKPPVLQGDRGLSQKGAERGNASYYYSLTRMATRGKVSTPSGAFNVSGNSWMDREWSTSALDAGTQGWDWFALQLDDGRDIMFYNLRQKDGASHPLSKGMLVAPDGSAIALSRDDVKLEPLDVWTASDKAGGERRAYPVRWRMTIPSANLSLNVAARIPDQEMNVSTVYWEGAVSLDGTADGKPVRGVGYLEMTGYGSEALSDRL